MFYCSWQNFTSIHYLWRKRNKVYILAKMLKLGLALSFIEDGLKIKSVISNAVHLKSSEG